MFSNCKKYHLKKHKEHILIPLYNFDSLCPKNGQTINFYCNDCKKNLCTLCINEHSKHKIESLPKILVKNNEINDIKNKIKHGKNYIRLIYFFTLWTRIFIFFFLLFS